LHIDADVNRRLPGAPWRNVSLLDMALSLKTSPNIVRADLVPTVK